MKLAVLGARGIGAIHARLIHQLGARVVAILGTSEATANAATDQLLDLYGFRPHPYSNLDQLLAEQCPDAVIIATPPCSHAKILLRLAKDGLPVFCEKPLIDVAGLSGSSAEELLNILIDNNAIPQFIGTSNTYLAANLPVNPLPQITNVDFTFHTNGPYHAEDIGWDLLPHGFSILQSLGIVGVCESARHLVETHKYIAEFQMNGVHVRFDFRQGKNIPKCFSINLNNLHSFERVQKGRGETYQVFWRDNGGILTEREDPFRSAMKDFMRLVDGENVESFCRDSETNMRQIIDFAAKVGLLA